MRRSTVLLAAIVGFGVLYLGASIALGSTPGAGEDGQSVASWFRDNGGHVRTWLLLLTLAAPLFAIFASLVRAELPAPHRDLFFFGAIAFVAETAVQGWLWVGMAWHASQLQPATARTLLDVASLWGPVLTGTTVMMLAPVAVLGLRGEAQLPRWLGWIAGIAVVEQLVETITIFGRHGFIAPGGPMNIYLGAGLVALALLCLGITVARTSAAAERKSTIGVERRQAG